jgi:hypothetical protein
MTPWGLSLLNLQNEFEERMQSRMARGSSPFIQSLADTRRYFDEWNSAMMAERKPGSPLVAMTPWGANLAKMQKEFESRMEKRSFRKGAVAANSWRARVHNRRARKIDVAANSWRVADRVLESNSNLAWAAEFPGAAQARKEHAERMQQIEDRRQARAMKSKTAMSWAGDFPGFAQAMQEHAERMQQIESRRQARRERQAYAQSTQDGFKKYFAARKDLQEQLRNGRTDVTA